MNRKQQPEYERAMYIANGSLDKWEREQERDRECAQFYANLLPLNYPFLRTSFCFAFFLSLAVAEPYKFLSFSYGLCFVVINDLNIWAIASYTQFLRVYVFGFYFFLRLNLR